MVRQSIKGGADNSIPQFDPQVHVLCINFSTSGFRGVIFALFFSGIKVFLPIPEACKLINLFFFRGHLCLLAKHN